MNIKQAKEEIKHTVRAYLAKDAAGEYKIPAIRQRPLLLTGPPGIGKTQIMEQAAAECGIGLVAYTITHHTRQSAVGLPFIREEEFDGETYSVTEYTMSEIIASVWRCIRDGGIREGILFIDEINCVSETLAPTMLQFLQCKTFGNQAVPPGWLIVAAGNPPEYNRSVRDFDMVTLDRVRYIRVEADLSVWKEYARAQHIHGAVLSYLELRPRNFYRVEADVDGMQFVTARGWEDLSGLMECYEEEGIPVTEEIVQEFLHHAEVAEDAAAYFDLYRKYRDDYGIPEILSGRVKPDVYARIYAAAFDERLAVVSLLLSGLEKQFTALAEERRRTDAWYAFLKEYRERLTDAEDPYALYGELLAEREEACRAEKKKSAAGIRRKRTEELLLPDLRKWAPARAAAPDMESSRGTAAPGMESSRAAAAPGMESTRGAAAEGAGMSQEAGRSCFADAKRGFEEQKERLSRMEEETARASEFAFDFMEQAFEAGQEMVVFVTELTLNSEAALFFSDYACERYAAYSSRLLTGTRRAELLAELERKE